MISSSKIFSPLRISISPWNQIQIRWFLIPWNRFEVLFNNLPFSPTSIINFLSDLINFEDYIKKFLISLWIRPLFTIIPFNLIHFHQIGKFEIIFDAIPCEINDLAVSSRQSPTKEKFRGNIVPHRRKKGIGRAYRGGSSTLLRYPPIL